MLLLRVSLSCTVVMSEGHRSTSFIQQYGLLLSVKMVWDLWGSDKYLSSVLSNTLERLSVKLMFFRGFLYIYIFF